VRWSAGLHECRVRAPGMSNSGPVESRDFLGNLGALGAHLSALWGRMFGILGANTPICTSRRSSSRYGTVCGFVENRAGEPHRLRHGESGCDTDLCMTWASPASCGHREGKGCATTQGRLAQRASGGGQSARCRQTVNVIGGLKGVYLECSPGDMPRTGLRIKWTPWHIRPECQPVSRRATPRRISAWFSTVGPEPCPPQFY